MHIRWGSRAQSSRLGPASWLLPACHAVCRPAPCLPTAVPSGPGCQGPRLFGVCLSSLSCPLSLPMTSLPWASPAFPHCAFPHLSQSLGTPGKEGWTLPSGRGQMRSRSCRPCLLGSLGGCGDARVTPTVGANCWPPHPTSRPCPWLLVLSPADPRPGSESSGLCPLLGSWGTTAGLV